METYNQKVTLVVIVLLIYTVFTTLALTFSLSSGQPPVTGIMVMTLVGITCLFLIAVSVILTILNSFRKTISLLEKNKQKVEKELEDVCLSHEKTIERRTLEIAVINASLNREIAERIQAESSALELQKQMELILNSAGEGIFGLDMDGNVTFANTSALLMIGWEKDELIGKPHHELVHHSHADSSPNEEKDCPIRQTYDDGIVHSCSNDVFWTKEGTCFPVEYVSTPIIDNSHICGAVVVFRDTSMFS